MRSFIAAAAFAAVALANPVPQGFSWEDIDSAKPIPKPVIPVVDVNAKATVIDVNLAAATAAVAAQVAANGVNKRDEMLVKRGACAPQQAGAGPTPSPDTDSAFLADSDFSNAALNAQTPSGYDLSYQNLQASSSAYGYLGYRTLSSYDVQTCANQCNAIEGCVAFNVFYERDPSASPDDTQCPNPPSTTNIKCVWWGGPVTPQNANNAGQWRSQFHVVIAGSNGYTSHAIATPSGYTGPTYLGKSAINAPLDCNGYNTFMGVKIFTSGAFDASLCSAACDSQTAYNAQYPPATGSPQVCTFFNTYILYDNGQSVGQYCALYNETWAPSYATNNGQYRGSDHYTIDYSFTFSNANNPGTCVKSS